MPEGRVLITRPAGQGAGLARRLAEAGFQVTHEPMLELKALDGPSAEQRGLLLRLDEYQHIIFVSANAIRFGMDWIGDYWPQLPVGLNWYTVGEASAKLLADFGVEVKTPAVDMSSEGLLALPELAAPTGERVLIVRGEGGRTTLAETLGERGAAVDSLCCYRRQAPELPRGYLDGLLQEWRIEIVCLSSGEGLANFLTLLSPEESTKLRDTWILLPSERVGEQARAAGLERLIVAGNASDDSVCQALARWRSESGGDE